MPASRKYTRPTIPMLLVVVCFAANAARAPTAYATADKSFSFTVPAGWQVSADGDKLHLSGPDGSDYTITRDTLPAPGGEPANSPALRSAAENLVKPLLSNANYAGVKPVKVTAGAGAVYRFRGKGRTSDSDLAEVWFAIIGKHTVTLLPDKAPQPDHLVELSTLFESLAFADSPKTAGPAAAKRATNPGDKTSAPNAAKAVGKRTLADGAMEGRAASAVTSEMERYEGHILGSDTGFTLHLNHDNSATLDWLSSPAATARFTGTYAGTDGNYIVNLNQTSGTNRANAKTMTLYLQGIGGEETGQYTTDLQPGKKTIAEIKLTSVDAGKIKLRGTKASAARANTSMNRGNTRGYGNASRNRRRSYGGVQIYGSGGVR